MAIRVQGLGLTSRGLGLNSISSRTEYKDRIDKVKNNTEKCEIVHTGTKCAHCDTHAALKVLAKEFGAILVSVQCTYLWTRGVLREGGGGMS